MKLDLFKQQWLDIVFEGRNQSYGAYELRKENTKTQLRALIIGAVLFAFFISIPVLINMIPDAEDDIETIDEKIVTVKVNKPKEEKPKQNLPPPPPPPPKIDQVKFVKPEVAKAEEVVEDPPVITEVKDKNIGAENIKGDPDAELTIEPVGNGPKQVVEEVDESIYSSAAIQVKAEFPGGIAKFYKFISNKYQYPDKEGLVGNVIVYFVVEKDGSLSDIKVLRDIGYGTGAEAVRVLKSCPKWTPGEQNGKKVRQSYTLPIKIQSAE